MPGKVVEMYLIMQQAFVAPDKFTFPLVLKACGGLLEAVHAQIFRHGFEEEVVVKNALLSFYPKCGENYLGRIISKNIKSDAVTIQCSVLAAAQLGSLEQASWIEKYVDNNSKFRNDVIISTALIDIYAKCGSVELARKVFNRIADKDVVVWSAMIMGYALNGWGREAINLFNEMKDRRVHPNEVIFIGLITACSHSGLVDEEWQFFLGMKDYIVEPRQKHYACVVDLLGRAGNLEKAHDFITALPVEPAVSVWGALLSACKVHRRVTLGEHAAEKLFSLDPHNTGHYVQLSNLYASARMWGGVEKVRLLMKSKEVNKDSGCSMVEITSLSGWETSLIRDPRRYMKS